MIEIGKITKSGLEGDGADHVASEARIGEAAMRASEPLAQHEFGEARTLAFKQCADIAGGYSVPHRHRFDRQGPPGEIGDDVRLYCEKPRDAYAAFFRKVTSVPGRPKGQRDE